MKKHGRSRVSLPLLLVVAGVLLCQVVAVAPVGAGVRADGLPGAFGKVGPANGATGQPLSLTLSWETSTDALRYEFCYDTSNDNSCAGWASAYTTSAAVSGLAANTTYYWHVRAVNSSGVTWSDGSESLYWGFATGSLPGAFGKTSPANYATGQPASVTLSWGASVMSPAGYYHYCYDTTNDNNCSAWTATDATSATISGLSANTNYYWHVRAVNPWGVTWSNGSASAYWRFTTGTAGGPGAFVKTAPANYATGQSASVTLSWSTSAMSPAGYYHYCYDTTNDNNCTAWVVTTETSAVISGLSANTTYYWHVRAVNSSGVTWSDGSSYAYWRFTTGTAGGPGAFVKTGPYNGATGQPASVTLSWSTSAMSPAGYYQYCYDTSNDNGCAQWTYTYLTNATISGLSANTTYYWHVRAANSSGVTWSNGSETAYWRFTTSGSGLPAAPGVFEKAGPANGATGRPTTVTLSWGTSAMSPAGYYQYCYDTTNDDNCAGWASTYSTSAAVGGLAANTTYYWHVRAVNSYGATWSNGNAGAYWRFTTGAQASVTMRFRSIGAYDGWVRESGEASGVGGALNSRATTCRVGDDSFDRQYRAILDFNTSRVPDNAVITRIVLKIRPANVVGANPVLTHGSLTVDIRRGAFNNGLILQTADFQSQAGRAAAGVFRTTLVAGGHYRSILRATGYPFVNLTGHTQFRLRFAVEDNDDGGADYLAFLCGDTTLVRDRPVLVVTYHVP